MCGQTHASTSQDGQGRGGCEQSSTVFFELFDEDTAGVRPEILAESRPQERVQRHTMEHIVDLVRVAPMVQTLDARVPQMVEQLPNVLLPHALVGGC